VTVVNSPAAPARTAAYDVLRRVFERGSYAEKALQTAALGLDARDRALATRLAYGAVQRRGTLDHLIESLAGRPVARLDGSVLAALRLGLYELLYLSGAPDYAVVGDAVSLAKAAGRGHGLVNAVLRRAGRDGGAALLETLRDGTPAEAAVKHSHPEWIAKLWWSHLGPAQARTLMAADNEPGELAVRANTLVATVDQLAGEIGVRTRRDELIPEALVLEEPFDLHGSAAFERGAAIGQSRAAMLAARMLDPQAGERVLELCAAPGGKTTYLAALMKGEGEVVAVEHNRARAERLGETARRMHAGSIAVELADAAQSRDGPPNFDRVLVDPPCSGLGTLQGRPDLRWRGGPQAIAEMAALQGRILASGAGALRPGGVLVYSTCTISATENEQQIERFLQSNPEFELDDLAVEHPLLAAANGLTPSSAGSTAVLERTLQTLPHRDHTAGFFIARMRRG
jgi:16S rRNA (cytosine967-C5)-methyltransferase